jgi:hypothetical protein
MADDLTLIKAMAVAAFYCGIKAEKIIHSKYDVPMEGALLIVFHELVALFLIMGIFFQTRPYIIFHTVISAFVFCLWFAFGRNCILTIFKRQLIPYTEEDFVLIYGNETEKVTTFVSVVGLSLSISLYKLLFWN